MTRACINIELMIPRSPRMFTHAYVRIKKLVQNGIITASSNRLRQTCGARPMKYATGNPTITQMIVDSAAYHVERRKIFRYSGPNARAKFSHVKEYSMSPNSSRWQKL